MYSALSTLNTTTEVRPLSKALNPQLLPGRRSINGCPLLRVCVHGVCVFTAVCVHFGWDKCRTQNSECVSPYLAVCHITSFLLLLKIHDAIEEPFCLNGSIKNLEHLKNLSVSQKILYGERRFFRL